MRYNEAVKGDELMGNQTRSKEQLIGEAMVDTSGRASRVTPITSEMIKENPVLAAAGIFADDPVFDELILEIKKVQERERRRSRKEFSK
jgi:hypothetical protein